MNNAARYGIRWHSSKTGVPFPKTAPEPALFASAYQPAVNGGGNCNIGPGDPIVGLASGYDALCAGVEEAAGNGNLLKGVILGCAPQYSATEGAMVMRNVIAGGIVYGTNFERQTKAYYVPVDDAYFEMDVVNASTSFDTLAEYIAARGTNADHRLVYDAATARAVPQLDLATVATTTAQWRLRGPSKTALNQDMTGTNFKVIVEAFEIQTAGI